MALTATRDMSSPSGDVAVKVARQFEEYLAEGDQVRIERDQARERVVSLERELASVTTKMQSAQRFAFEAVLLQARTGCAGLDRLRVEAVVENAAESIGVDL